MNIENYSCNYSTKFLRQLETFQNGRLSFDFFLYEKLRRAIVQTIAGKNEYYLRSIRHLYAHRTDVMSTNTHSSKTSLLTTSLS